MAQPAGDSTTSAAATVTRCVHASPSRANANASPGPGSEPRDSPTHNQLARQSQRRAEVVVRGLVRDHPRDLPRRPAAAQEADAVRIAAARRLGVQADSVSAAHSPNTVTVPP